MGSIISRPRRRPDTIAPAITLITTHISHSEVSAAVESTRHLELQEIGALDAAAESEATSISTTSASSTSTSTPAQAPKAPTTQTNHQCLKTLPKEHFPQIRIYRIKSKSKSKSKSRPKNKSQIKTTPTSKTEHEKSNLSNTGVLLIVMPPGIRIHGWTRDSLLVGEIPRLKGFGFRSEKELDYGLLSASEALGAVISQLDVVIGIERLFSWR